MYEHNKILQQVQTGHNTVRILKTVYFFCFCVIQCSVLRSSTFVLIVTWAPWLREKLWVICFHCRNAFLASHHTWSCNCVTALTLHLSYDRAILSSFIPLWHFLYPLITQFTLDPPTLIWPLTFFFHATCNPTLFESHIWPMCPCRDNPWCLKNDDVSSDLFVPWEWAFLLFDNSWHVCFHIRFKIWPIC